MAMNTRLTLLNKQYEFVTAPHADVLYSGAVGAGKTVAGLAWLLTKIVGRPRARVGLCRKSLRDLKKTTLRTLLDGDGEFPPMLPPGTYSHHKTENTITLNGGGQIQYFGMDALTKTGSLNIGSVLMDEAIEFTEDDRAMLSTRVRTGGAGRLQLGMVTNPGPQSHWIYKDFICSTPTWAKVVMTTTYDNHHLPEEYIARLKNLKGQYYDRWVLGKWGSFEGLVYDMFARQTHVWSGPPIAQVRSWVGGVDEGYTNPATAVLFGIDGDGRMHQFREFYERGVLPADHVAAIAEIDQWAKTRGAKDVPWVVDPSAAGLIASMADSGLDAVPAENDVDNGIRAVRARLSPAGDGRPRLTVSPECIHSIAEYESYINRPGTGKPQKENDHAMDATRYAVMFQGDGSPLAELPHREHARSGRAGLRRVTL